MPLARLFLSGLLVAGGLILGAFTLHGYFDPQWAQRQMHAAGLRERPSQPKAVNTFQGRSRFVSSHGQHPAPNARPQTVTTNGPPGAGNVVKAADAKPAAKSPAKKKLAEKAKPPPQQASLQWPWNLFNN